MESRFVFLEDDCPKLAEYGRKAEECMAVDPNLCLLCLGRIAEFITEDLCRRCNITESSEKLSGLTEKGLLTDDIARKISALIECRNEAADFGYDSEMACKRLIVTAEELCRWFITEKLEGRFSFLADIFPPDKPVPILMNFSELGREAEENLFINTRYCLICLGDMGEAVTDRLISDGRIETHEKEQIARIEVLFENNIITPEVKNILHALRIARNNALHERYKEEYTSEPEGRRLIDEALRLGEWIFRETMRPGYAVKARITGKNDGGYSAVIGRIPADVPADEVPEGKSCVAGKKYIFKISDVEGGNVTLSLKDADNDSGLTMARLYAKYKPGQDVRVTIKSLSNSTGAIVELKDGLEARIPSSELGHRIYRYGEEGKMVRYDVTARVKWFSLTQYPPMLLSVKDVEEGEREHKSAPQPVREPKPAMSDLDFRLFCKSAPYEKIIQALDEGANPNATNSNNTTALMMAAQFSKSARVVKALIDAGAELDTQNHKGNTALMYAAMSNCPEIVRVIYDAGADIELVNKGGKKAADFAVANKKLNGTDLVRLLRDEPEEIPVATPEPEATPEPAAAPEPAATPEPEAAQEPAATPEPVAAQEPAATPEPEAAQEPAATPEPEAAQEPEPEHEPEQEVESDAPMSYYEYSPDENASSEDEAETLLEIRRTLQRNFLKICRSGSEDEIAEAVSAGVNVNVTNKTSATALMFAAKSNTAAAVEILIHAGAILDAKDDNGNTALIYAGAYNTDDVVETLIEAGADTDIRNTSGHKARDYAARNYRLIDTEALSRL